MDVLWSLARAGGRAEAPSRHHAHLHRRAGGGRGGGGPGSWLLHVGWSGGAKRKLAKHSARSWRTHMPYRLPAETTALGLALRDGADCGASATCCSTGPTTMGCGRFSPSIRAGMRAALCSSPSRCCGRCCWLALVIPWSVGSVGRGDRRAAQGVSRARLGDFRAGGYGGVVVLALGGARAGLALIENTQILRSGEAHGRGALSHQSFPLARDSRDGGLLPDCRNQHPDRRDRQRSADGRALQAADRLRPSKPPNGPRWARFIWTGARGPWCATWARSRLPGWPRRNCRLTASGRRSSSAICALTTPTWARARATGRNPLGGWVYIVDGREDAGEAMGGREQR